MAAVFLPAYGSTIGVNFTNGGILMQPTDQPGVVPGADWNNVIGGSGTGIALHDSTGAATTATISFTAAGVYGGFSHPSTTNSATNLMYADGLYGDPSGGGEVQITLSNIPYAEYDVYVYASQDGSQTNVLSITDGTTRFYYRGNGSSNSSASSLLLTASTNPGSPTVGPAQYQLFSNETLPSVTLTTGGSVHNVISNNVFGLQIVDLTSPTPEPDSVLLLAGGLSLMIFITRRGLRR
ncbi:MAG TPA: hypothetical protein VKX45_12355 [Bryobacteraceae bacterium]|nr:hypothetical protein [Bryobacteraceae bacterium]